VDRAFERGDEVEVMTSKPGKWYVLTSDFRAIGSNGLSTPRFLSSDLRFRFRKKVSPTKLVRHVVDEDIKGELIAGPRVIDMWPRRKACAGFEFEGSDRLWANPIYYVDGAGNFVPSPSIDDVASGRIKVVRPIAVWELCK